MAKSISKRFRIEKSITMNKVLSKKEVADSLQISVRQVDYLRKEGKLPYVQIERSIRFRTEDIERFLVERVVVPQEKKNPQVS